MGGKRRGNKGKDKGKMKVENEGQGSEKETVTEREEQGARKETVMVMEMEEQGAGKETEKQKQKEKEKEEGVRKETDSETEEHDLLDCCVFLVRTRNVNLPPQPTYEKSVLSRPVCFQEDFHYIDLRSKFVIPNYFPSIINCVGAGTMLRFDNRQVYILGDINQLPPRIPHTHNDVNNHLHKHTGSSRTSIHKCWNPFVLPDSNKKFVNPAVLSNKLYCFGYPFFRPEVYDPWRLRPDASNPWNPLVFPDHLVDQRVSIPVLPDPFNNRIIVHFPVIGMLYAFYPHLKKGDDNGHWKCIVPNFDTWYSAIAIADNIIYFHSHELFPDFAAYDINTSTWLHILWDLSKVDRFMTRFDAMFALSEKGLMCLVSLEDGASVYFLRFKMKRISDAELTFTAIDYQMHAVPSSMGINDIILF